MQTGLFTFFQSNAAIEKNASEFLGIIGVSLLVSMRQIGQRYARICKMYAAHGLWRIGLKEWGRHAPLYRLRNDLIGWNRQRLQHTATSALNAQDIASIRQLIARAEQQSSLSLPPTLLDQWFFLAIGAVQVESQTGNSKAWQLFDQSVHSQLEQPTFYRALSFGMVVSLCVLWMGLVPVKKTQMHTELSPLTVSTSAYGTADPVTLSLLNLAYQKMQNGSCQLPQAAMLPEVQRHAFMLFITEGKVDVNQVEHLRHALGYVSCLYPQELMRPQGRDRLTTN